MHNSLNQLISLEITKNVALLSTFQQSWKVIITPIFLFLEVKNKLVETLSILEICNICWEIIISKISKKITVLAIFYKDFYKREIRVRETRYEKKNIYYHSVSWRAAICLKIWLTFTSATRYICKNFWEYNINVYRNKNLLLKSFFFKFIHFKKKSFHSNYILNI